MLNVRAFATIACCTLIPIATPAQTAQRPQSGVFRTFLEGVAAGGGLGIAYIQPNGEGWLVSDETAIPLFAMTGVVTAFLARAQSADLDPEESHRPRLRVGIGRSDKTKLDYSMGLRLPMTARFDIQTSLLVASDTWEKIEEETRCDPFLGCFTDDFVTDTRYEQSLSAMISGVYLLSRNSVNPSLSLGAGPVITHLETQADGRSRRTGVMLEAMLGVEQSGRSRWTAEVGARMVSGTEARGTRLQARIGRAFGY